MNLLTDGIQNDLVKKTEMTTKLTIDGITEIYPVYKIRLDLLYYNDRNDRIATWISQYIAANSIDTIDKTSLENYNDIIQEFIEKSNPQKIKDTQKNIEFIGQQKYGIVLKDGRIIDGNRRFTCLRNLAKNDPKFNYFEAVILDKDIEDNAKQIKMLELQLQIGEDAKVDYDPIDKLVGIYRDIIENKLLTIHEYAMSVNQKDKEVEKSVELATLLVEFLETINAPKQFYLARELDLNGPLHELHAILKKEKDEDRKELIKNIIFANLLIQPSGDMTRFVRQIKNTILPSKYSEEFIEKECDIVEVIIDKLPPSGEVNESTINGLRREEETQEVLKDTMDIFENKAKVSDTKNKPSKLLSKIYDSLEEIDQNIFLKLNDNQKENISEQLDLIEDKIDEIRGSLDV